MSDRQENVTVNEGTADQDFTVGTSGNNLKSNENTVNVNTLERCFNKRIDRELGKIVETFEDTIQNAFLTAIDIIVAHKIELAIRPVNAASGRNVTIITANFERWYRRDYSPF